MSFPQILNDIHSVRAAVIGDFCLDVYWQADMRLSELSRETPHYPLPIVSERMSPGGAGNVVNNLCALKPNSVTCIGVFGNDWRGHALKQALVDAGADISRVVTSPNRVTNTYIKPLRQGISDVVYEDPRLDFTNYSPLTTPDEDALIDDLQAAAATIDVLCVCDQMPCGCITPRVRDAIIKLGQQGLRIIVDSRDRIADYTDVIVKPNDIEACRALGEPHTTTLEILMGLACRLENRTHRPAVITVGDQGCVISENGHVTHVPAFAVNGEIDICGAGDTFLSAFAAASATGASLADAAHMACKASSIIVKKLKTTGTASPQEILG